MENKTPIQALIFDMGGVLLRTVDPSKREGMAARYGATRRELEMFIFASETSILSERGEFSDIDHWKTVMRHFGQPEADFPEAYTEMFSGDALNTELLDFGVSLKPHIKLGFLSNAWENTREHAQRKYQFLQLFDATVFSYEVKLRKPEPGMYHAILERLQVKPEAAIFVDDMQENVDGAITVGMQALRFTDNETVIAALKERLGTAE